MAVDSLQEQLLTRLPNLRLSSAMREYRGRRLFRREELLLRLREVLVRMMDPRTKDRTATVLPLMRESSESRVPIFNLGFASDRNGNYFRAAARVIVPNLLGWAAGSAESEGLTHLMVHVGSPYVPEHPEREYEVTLSMGGHVIERRLFHRWYAQHSFLLPFHLFGKQTQDITIEATSTRGDKTVDSKLVFTVDAFACSEAAILDRLARGAIWLFSTARSGSTWLAADVVCANHRARLIDESGIGRMFAPLQTDPQRFDRVAESRRSRYVESGFAFETGEKKRAIQNGNAVFERAFTSMDLENQILSRHNFGFYHEMLREVALKHAINEWGCRHFDRIVFKCPNEGQGADFIMRAFPESRMVFLMRDGRDVLRSRFSPFASPLLSRNDDPELRRYAIAYFSHMWNFQIDIIRTAYDAHPEKLRVFLKYEDLRTDPDRTIGDVLFRLGFDVSRRDVTTLAAGTTLESVPASQRGPDKPRQEGLVGGYKQTFSPEEIGLMNVIMGPNLKRYGYEA